MFSFSFVFHHYSSRPTSNAISGVPCASPSSSSARTATTAVTSNDRKVKGQLVFESSRHPAEREDFEATGNETYTPGRGKKSYNNQYDGDTLNTSSVKSISTTSPKQAGKREEGWKEVVRK